MNVSESTDNVSGTEQAVPASVETTDLPATTDASAPSNQPDPAESESAEERGKRERTALDRRFSKLIGRAAKAEARAEQAEKRAAELEAQQQSRQPAQQRGKPDDGAPRQEDFEDYDSYFRATLKHEAKVAFEEAQSANRKADEQRKTEEIQQKRIDRFNGGIEQHKDQIPDLMEALERVPNARTLTDELLDCDEPVAVGYYLGHHPAELADLLDAGDQKVVSRRLAKLEDKAVEFAKSRSRSKAKPQTAPLRSSVGSAPGTLRDNSGMDEHISSYRRYRAKRGY